jgi:hypothetical protein
MPYSYQTHTLATASAGPFSFAGIDGYLSIDHIKVYIDGVLHNSSLYTVDEVAKEITFSTTHPANSVILIRRETPKGTDDRSVVFTSGAIVRPDDLNRSVLQSTFIAQETEDLSIKDVDPANKVAGYVLTWDASAGQWEAAEPTGGEGGGVTIGVKGEIEVVTSSDWRIRNDVVDSDALGGDITAAGKALLTAATADAQKFALSLSQVATTGNYNDLATKAPTVTVSSSGLMTAADKSKLDGIATGAEVNVQSDWNATSGDAFIQNKPSLGTASSLDVPASPGTSAGSTQVVRGDDPRLADSRSPTTHTHTASDITSGLATVATSGSYADLINKPTVPTNLGDLSDVSNAVPISGQVLKFNGSVWAPGTDNTSGGGGGGGDADTLDGNDGTYYLDRTNHTGSQAISTVTNLQTTLDGKAASVHTHIANEITDAGTVITRNVPASGNAGVVEGVAEVVIADDTRLSDTRTPSASSVTTSTIVDDAVTYAKIQNVTSGRLLGRADPVAGEVEEIRCYDVGFAFLNATDAAEQRTAIGVTPLATDSYVGQIDSPSTSKTYWIDRKVSTARTITEFYAICTSGTVTATLYSGASGATQVGQIGVNSTGGTAPTLTNTAIAANGVLRIVVSNVSSPSELAFVIKYGVTL